MLNPTYVLDDARVWVRGQIDSAIKIEDIVNELRGFDEGVSQMPLLAQGIYGQFALVIEFEAKGLCYLIADAIGAEPLYYLSGSPGIRWSFRVAELIQHLPTRELDPRGLDESMLYRWLNEDRTMLEGVRRVNPGEIVELAGDGSLRKMKYFNVRYRPAIQGDPGDWIIEKTNEALDNYLARARSRTSRVAVLLSGGVDSSLLLAKAREHSFEKLMAVTFEFSGAQNPELSRARTVAETLGVPLRVVAIDDAYINENLPRIVRLVESPNAYFNCIARLRMVEAIAGEVDGIIIGEGADGMFSMEVGGGTRALRFERKSRMVNWIPKGIRGFLAERFFRGGGRMAVVRDILNKDGLTYLRRQGEALADEERASVEGGVSIERAMPALTSIRENRGSYFYRAYEPDFPGELSEAFVVEFCQNRGLYTQNRHQYWCYSAICTEFGLSLMAPFLSKEIMDIGLVLPNHLRSDSRGPKPILKSLVSRYIPEELVYAKKLGFETPLSDWLDRNRDYWMGLLVNEDAKTRHMLDLTCVPNLDPRRDSSVILSLLMFELFVQQFVSER